MTTTKIPPGKKSEALEELPELIRRRDPPLPLWLKLLCVAGAALLVVLGIIGWLVPIVTGIPFYIAALILAGLASDRVRGWVNAMDRKLPHRLRKRLRRRRERKKAERESRARD